MPRRYRTDRSLGNPRRMRVIRDCVARLPEVETLACLAEQGAYPVTHAQAVTVITLVLHYLWDEWRRAEDANHPSQDFHAGADAVWRILHMADGLMKY